MSLVWISRHHWITSLHKTDSSEDIRLSQREEICGIPWCAGSRIWSSVNLCIQILPAISHSLTCFLGRSSSMMLPMMLKAMSTTLRLDLLSSGRSLKVRPRSISLWSKSGDLMYLKKVLALSCTFRLEKYPIDSLCANGDQRRVDVGRGQVGVEVREHFPHPLVNVRGHFGGKFNFISTFSVSILTLIDWPSWLQESTRQQRLLCSIKDAI